MARTTRQSVLVDFEKIYHSSEPESYFGPVEPSFHHILLAAKAAGLGKCGVALDMGCGDGRHARVLAGAGWGVVGLDGAIEGLRKARRLIGDQFTPVHRRITSNNIYDITSQLTAHNFGRPYDLIVSMTFLDHLEPDLGAELLPRLKDVLRPGGLFIASVMTTWDPGCSEAMQGHPPGLTSPDVGTSDTVSAVRHYYREKELLSAFTGWPALYFADSFEFALHAPDHCHGLETLCAIRP